LRPLAEAAPILIGDNVWIGDGARILAGSVIPAGSIVGANSVVKAKFTEPGVIAGAPASMKRRF
jgi:acetyltransferase-like isoleucine patch superfamily enzyme